MNKLTFILLCSDFVFGVHTPNESPPSGDGKPVIICNDVIELEDGILQVGFSTDKFLPLTTFVKDEFPLTDANEWASGLDAAVIRSLANMILLPGRRTPIQAKFIYTTPQNFEEDLLKPLGFPASFDASIGFITSLADRESQFNVRFLNYSGDAPTTVVVPDTEDPNDYLTYEGLCGKKLTMLAGTIFESFMIEELNKICDSANKPAVIAVATPTPQDGHQLLFDGEVDGVIMDVMSADIFLSANEGYFNLILGCKWHPDPVTAGPPFREALHLGIYVNAASTELFDCLQRGINKMDAQGKLTTLFDIWVEGFVRSSDSKLACVALFIEINGK